MNEHLPKERIEPFLKAVSTVVRAEVLTNLEAVAILEILQRACEREMNADYEEMIIQMVNNNKRSE